MIDVIALTALALLGYLGWRRGTILTALSAGSLLAGYVGAFMLYRPMGRLLEGVFSVPPILAFPLGGMVAMVTVTLLLRLLAGRLRARRFRRIGKGWTPSYPDRVGGAAIGMTWALGVVIFLSWAAIVFHGLTGRGPDVERTLSGQLASAAVGKAVHVLAKRFTGDEVLASTMALVAVKPSEGAKTVSRLVGSTQLRSLFENRDLRATVMRSDFAAVARQSGLLDLARDRTFLEAAERVGLIEQVGVDAAPEQIAVQLVERIAPMVRTADDLSKNLDVQRILQSPEFLERLHGGDLGTLATDRDFNRLAEEFLEAFRASRSAGSGH